MASHLGPVELAPLGSRTDPSGLGLLQIFPVPATSLPLPANQICINKLYVPGFAR